MTPLLSGIGQFNEAISRIAIGTGIPASTGNLSRAKKLCTRLSGERQVPFALLALLKNFLANAHDHAQALRPGGRQQLLSLDFSV